MYVPRYEHQYSIMPPLYSNINLRDLYDLRFPVSKELRFASSTTVYWLSSKDITRNLQTRERMRVYVGWYELMMISARYVAVGFRTLFIVVIISVLVFIFLIIVAVFTLALMESERDELISELSIFSCDLTRAGRTISSNSDFRPS